MIATAMLELPVVQAGLRVRAVWRSAIAGRHRPRVHAAGWLLLSLCCSCGSSPSPLRAAGPGALQLRDLTLIVVGMGAVVFLLVMAILIYALARKPGTAEEESRHPFGTALVWIGGIVAPLLILGTVYLLTVRGMIAFAGAPPPALTIEVTGHQWWWEVRYPQQGFTTANEIHIPVGQPTRIEVTSVDVIHSFWVPQLQGKFDAVPGRTNTIPLQSSQAGTYRGQCLVYCGLQHANMNFLVVADPPDAFAAWLSDQRSAPRTPTDAALVKGQQVFLGSACVYCHNVTGTDASAHVGPDLTHFGSRRQIGAGALANNPAALGDWLIDPQTSKPGNLMPPEHLSAPELQALVAYLESLK